MKHMTILTIIMLLTACSAAPDIASQTLPQIIETGVDSTAWALIPAGEFPSGQHDHMTEMDYEYQIMITDGTPAVPDGSGIHFWLQKRHRHR